MSHSPLDWTFLFLAVLYFIGLVVVNYRLSGSTLAPGTVFSATWCVSLFAILLAGDSYFPLSIDTLLVYILGATFLSLGSVYVLDSLRRKAPPYPEGDRPPNSAVSVSLNVLLLVLLAGLPLYYDLVLSQIGKSDTEMLMFRKRRFELENEESRGFDPVNNLPILAFLVSAVAVYESRGSWWRRSRAVIALLVALGYGAMTGSKASSVTVLMTAMFIKMMSGRRFNPLVAVSVVALSLVGFSVGLLAVNFVGKSPDDLADNFPEIVEVIQLYWLGALVAFNFIVQAPGCIESTQSMSRPFLLTANSFGGNYRIPSLHAEFSPVGGDLFTNTYTVYFTYFKDLGWIGMCGVMCVLGALLAWCYHRARYGGPIATIFYAMFCTGLVLSVHAEHFLLELNYYAKTLIFLGILYGIPWDRFKQDAFSRARGELRSG